MIKVYHQMDRDFRFQELNDGFQGKFCHVADVETNDLEESYFLTNSVNCPWWVNKGVEKHIAEPCRSTSVGDALVRDGKWYAVCNFGFKEIC
jgi:hypothetical protein